MKGLRLLGQWLLGGLVVLSSAIAVLGFFGVGNIGALLETLGSVLTVEALAAVLALLLAASLGLNLWLWRRESVDEAPRTEGVRGKTSAEGTPSEISAPSPPTRQPPPPPTTVTQHELDRLLALGLKAAQEQVASDAMLEFAFLDLYPKVELTMRGYTPLGHKTFQIDATRLDAELGREPQVYAIKRESRSTEMETAAPWSLDETWAELVRLSWERQRPFEGEVKLYLRSDRNYLPSGTSMWRIRYRSASGPVIGEASFGLEQGRLVPLEDW